MCRCSPRLLPVTTAVPNVAHENARSALICVLGMGAFVTTDALSKKSVALYGVPVLQMLELRSAGMVLVFSAVVACTASDCPSIVLRDRVLLGIRAILEGLGSWFFTLGLVHLPISNAIAIVQALPLVVMVGTALLGEPISTPQWLIAICGFSGVIIIVQPEADGISPWAACTLLAVACMAVRDVSTRSLNSRVPSSVVSLAASLGLLGFSSSVALFQSEGWSPISHQALGCVAGATLTACAGFFSSVELMRAPSGCEPAPFTALTLNDGALSCRPTRLRC